MKWPHGGYFRDENGSVDASGRHPFSTRCYVDARDVVVVLGNYFSRLLDVVCGEIEGSYFVAI